MAEGTTIAFWVLIVLLGITVLTLIAFIIYHYTRVYDLKTEVETVKKNAASKSDNGYGFDVKDYESGDDIYLGVEVKPNSDAVMDVAQSIKGTLSGFQGQLCSEINKSLGGVTFSQYVNEELPSNLNIPCDELRNDFRATVEDPINLGFPGAEQLSKDVGNVFEAVLKHSCDDKGMLDRGKTKDLTAGIYESVCFGLASP